MLDTYLAKIGCEAIAAAAVVHAVAMHQDAPDFCRKFPVADEAAHEAGRAMHAAVCDFLGVPAFVTPFGAFERAAKPYVAATLAARASSPKAAPLATPTTCGA
jgi:hypothetical protein